MVEFLFILSYIYFVIIGVFALMILIQAISYRIFKFNMYKAIVRLIDRFEKINL